MLGPGWKPDQPAAGFRQGAEYPLRTNSKPTAITAAELKRQIPDVIVVAGNLYGIEFRNGVARCLFPQNHHNGDRDPSLRYDKKKDRLFCASQHCLGEKGVDAIGLVQLLDQCSCPEAIKKLADHYAVPTGGHSRAAPRS